MPAPNACTVCPALHPTVRCIPRRVGFKRLPRPPLPPLQVEEPLYFVDFLREPVCDEETGEVSRRGGGIGEGGEVSKGWARRGGGRGWGRLA